MSYVIKRFDSAVHAAPDAHYGQSHVIAHPEHDTDTPLVPLTQIVFLETDRPGPNDCPRINHLFTIGHRPLVSGNVDRQPLRTYCGFQERVVIDGIPRALCSLRGGDANVNVSEVVDRLLARGSQFVADIACPFLDLPGQVTEGDQQVAVSVTALSPAHGRPSIVGADVLP